MLTLEFVPTYEYECPRCPRVFEVRQRISEPALTTCDRCGGPIRRLLSPAPFILKGGGWHVTDYPSEARKKAVGTEAGTKDSTGSEAKPEASKPGTDSAASPSSAPSSEPAKGSTKDSGGTSSSS